MWIRVTFSLIVLVQLTLGLDVNSIVKFAEHQYTELITQLKLGHQYPTNGKPDNTHWHLSGNKNPDWTVGFFPGVLWKLYQLTNKTIWKEEATSATDGLFIEQTIESNHDIGFMIMGSYGEAFAATGNKSYPGIIVNAAGHLSKRFNDRVGCTRSWGNIQDTNHFLVIVDNMMNLELLFKAYEISKNKTFIEIATSHTNRTIKEHLRPDFSSFHVVDFDPTTGKAKRKYTKQGYSDSSCWSRGQAWLITGFTRAYTHTKMEHFLEAAKNVAKYFIEHLPEDGIAPWDFSVPHDAKHVYIPRDTSASAIAAVGLFELFSHSKNQLHLKAARKIVESLSSTKYKIEGHPEYRLPALLANSTIMGPNGDPGKSDLSLIYTDYYYLQALIYWDNSNQTTKQ